MTLCFCNTLSKSAKSSAWRLRVYESGVLACLAYFHAYVLDVPKDFRVIHIDLLYKNI